MIDMLRWAKNPENYKVLGAPAFFDLERNISGEILSI